MVADLGRWASYQDAAVRLMELVDQPATRLELRRGRQRVADAIVAARGHVDAGLEEWYESVLPQLLMRGGLHDVARESLEAWFAVHDSDDDVADPNYRAPALRRLADVRHRDGDYDAALRAARRAQAAAQRGAAGPPTHRSMCESVLAAAFGVEARILVDVGRLGSAWEPLEQQAAAAARVDPGPDRNEALWRKALYRAEYFAAQDRYAQAMQQIDRCPVAAIERPLVRGWLALELEERRCGDDGAALAPVVDADHKGLSVLLADPMMDPGFVENGRVVLARTAIAAGRFDVAREQLEQLRSHRDQRLRSTLRADLAMLQTKLMLGTLPQGGVSIDAADRAALAGQRTEHEAALDALLREWRQTAPRAEGLGFLGRAARRRVVTELVRLVERIETPAAAARVAAERLVQLQALTSTARQLGVPDTSLAEVRTVFTGPRAGVLALLLEPAGSLLVAITRDGEQRFWLHGSGRIEAAVEDLRQVLASSALCDTSAARVAAGERLAECATRCADLLLPSAVREMLAGWDTVTVADHGMLDGLPWECLMLHDRLLGETLAVNTLTSLPLGIWLDRQRPAAVPAADASITLIATLAGNPKLTATADDAPRPVDDDVLRLGRDYPRRLVLVDDEATPLAVQALDLVGPVTQFFAHGACRRDQTSALALAPTGRDDGLYGQCDAEAAPVRGLVVVSACGVGRAERKFGDDVLHATLGGAFLRAGAHTVVQAAADLHVHAHARLLHEFHGLLQRGRSTATALAAARQQLRGAGADLVERFEHAQVQVFGLGIRPVFR